MRNLFLILLLTCAFVCVSLASALAHSNYNGSTPLMEPVLLGMSAATPTDRISESLRSLQDRGVRLANVGLESFFYGVLGICGILLALRAVFSALQIIKEERALKAREPVKSDYSLPVESVVSRYRKPAVLLDPGGAESGSAGVAGEQSPTGGWILRHGGFFASSAWGRVAPYGRGLTGRMIGSFTVIVALFSLLTLALVHFTLTASLRKSALQRARVTAINISNGAAAYLSKNNAEGVRGILRKQATNPEIAYILVENRKGEIVAQTFTALPENIPSTVAGGARNESQRALRLEGGEVYEVIMPVLDGQAGAVRLGIWRDHIEAEVSRTVKPLIQMLWWVAVGGVLMSVYLAWRINRPIIRLVRAAQRISTGDLEAPSLGVEDNSEFGELSRALERMRSSIKAAMVRMRDD